MKNRKQMLVIALMFMLISGIVQAQSIIYKIPLSAPGKRGFFTLSDNENHGAILVSGYNGDTVIVEVTEITKRNRISLLSFDYFEDKNYIIFKNKTVEKNIIYHIKVPKYISVNLRADFSKRIDIANMIADVKLRSQEGSIFITNVSGNTEAQTFDGNITATKLDGGALLTNSKGKISASFDKVTPGYFSNLTNESGSIEITLPSNAAASFRLRLELGNTAFSSEFMLKSIRYADFPLPVNKDDASSFRSINGGGTPFYINSIRGEVILKKGNK